MTSRLKADFTSYGIDKDLVLDFFYIFSRFEYALKRQGYIIGKPGDKVEPNWDKFASKINSQFESAQFGDDFKEAVKYLKAYPPKKQIIENDGVNIQWEHSVFREKAPITTWLLLQIRTVRNNLFHGGKYPQGSIQDPSRNEMLLKHSITILSVCLTMNKEVQNSYYDSIE